MDVFHLGFQALHVFNTWLPHGKKHSCYVYGNHHLVESIVILCKKRCLCILSYYVGQEGRDYSLNLIIWGSKRWEILLRLHLKEFWGLLKRDNYYAFGLIMSLFGNNYKIFHWCKVPYLYKQENIRGLIIWCLRGQTSLLQVTTNLLYHCSVESLGWLSYKENAHI